MIYYLHRYKTNLTVVLAMIAVVNINLWLDPNHHFDAHRGILIFYEQFSYNRYLLPMTLYLLLLPSFGVMKYYDYYENSFERQIMTRKGRVKYTVFSSFQAAVEAMITNALMQIMILVTIHLVWSDVAFIDGHGMFQLVSENMAENFKWYLICSNAGVGLFAVFLYFCIPAFKNKYVYRCFPVLLTLGCILAAVLAFPLLATASLAGKLSVSVLIQNLNPLGLITPGIMTESDLFLSFFSASVLFILLSAVMANLCVMLRRENV